MIGERYRLPVNTEEEKTAAWDWAFALRGRHGCCVRITEGEDKPDPWGVRKIVGKYWDISHVISGTEKEEDIKED